MYTQLYKIDVQSVHSLHIPSTLIIYQKIRNFDIELHEMIHGVDSLINSI